MRPKKNTSQVWKDDGVKKIKLELTGVSTYLGVIRYFENNGYKISRERVFPLNIQNTAMYGYMMYVEKDKE